MKLSLRKNLMLDMSCAILSIVVPCYNEEKQLESSALKLLDKLAELKAQQKINRKSFLLFVDDGSTDTTPIILERLQKRRYVKHITLKRNFGHQIAVIAGLDFASEHSDSSITIDCDLQQDINCIDKMVEHYINGYEIVLGVRKNRKSDRFLKKFTAIMFTIIAKCLGIKYLFGHADYRLLSSTAYLHYQQDVWEGKVLRTTFFNTQFPTQIVFHDVFARQFGESKYSIFKMLKLGFNTIFGSSYAILKLLKRLSIFLMLISMLICIYAIYSKIFLNSVAGWASLTILLCFFSGLIAFTQTLVGELVIKNKNTLQVTKPYSLSQER